MKKRRIITLIIIFLVLVGIGLVANNLIQSMNEGLQHLEEIEVGTVDLSTVPDGTFIGEYGQFPVSAIVEVTVLNHDITSIEIIEHNNGQGQNGELIIHTVVDHDSLQVDTIAGATYSSKVILLAIEDALVEQELAE
jgi:uncharacterized protein with FMN-binding domain